MQKKTIQRLKDSWENWNFDLYTSGCIWFLTLNNYFYWKTYQIRILNLRITIFIWKSSQYSGLWILCWTMEGRPVKKVHWMILVFMSLQMVSRAEAIQHHSVVCHMRAIENAPQQHFKLLEQNRLRQDKAPKLIQVCSLCPVNLLRRCWWDVLIHFNLHGYFMASQNGYHMHMHV